MVVDLLAPCRSCLQCLPFFFDSPPPSPRPSDHTSGDLPPPPSIFGSPHHGNEASAAPRLDQPTLVSRDVSPSDVLLEFAAAEDRDGGPRAGDLNPEIVTTLSEKIIIAPPVVSEQNEGRHVPSTGPAPATELNPPAALPLKVPFINDVDFSKAGLKPPAYPPTPAPFGSGYGQIHHGSSDESHGNGHGGGQNSHGHGQGHPDHHHNDGHRHPNHYHDRETVAQKLNTARGPHDGEELSHGAAAGIQTLTENGGGMLATPSSQET